MFGIWLFESLASKFNKNWGILELIFFKNHWPKINQPNQTKQLIQIGCYRVIFSFYSSATLVHVRATVANTNSWILLSFLLLTYIHQAITDG